MLLFFLASSLDEICPSPDQYHIWAVSFLGTFSTNTWGDLCAGRLLGTDRYFLKLSTGEILLRLYLLTYIIFRSAVRL